MAAVDESILKWEGIRAGDVTLGQGLDLCALCKGHYRAVRCPTCPLTAIGERCLSNKKGAWDKFQQWMYVDESAFTYMYLQDTGHHKQAFTDAIDGMLGALRKAKEVSEQF